MIEIYFEYNIVRTEYSETLYNFLKEMSNTDADKRVFNSYFGLEWPMLYQNIHDRYTGFKYEAKNLQDNKIKFNV